MKRRADLMVGAGAIVGVLARYQIGVLVAQYVPTVFPLGTFVINLLGCLLIGVVQVLFLDLHVISRETQLLLAVGLCGGFTTFSTFSVETIRLMQDGHGMVAFAYQVISLIGGIGAVITGMALARRLHQARGRR